MPSPAAAHLFVADLQSPELDAADAHHLSRVLRLRPGEVVTVSDGAGRWRPCRFTRSAGLEPDGEVVVDAAPTPAVTVGFAIVKGDRPDWVVQKLTELGVDRIVPLMAARSVVRWDGERALRHVQRLRTVAREAAMQSRRVWLPEVADVCDLDAGGPLEGWAPGAAATALAHPGGTPPSLAQPTILVGPEGGWTPAEVGAAPVLVGLGPTVLRTETAALCAGVVLSVLRSGLLGSGLLESGQMPRNIGD